ncbi:MAG: hypothetical protein QF515_10905 [Pseudomonadales bacterium]|jgi:hypothetical protein|nr:hypothetical protein [Pseudomonadales bacterium]|tara:strand:- start:2643 stop:2915 length:273 start_codon:yes stop_codon:yes gene_type:complete
MLLQPTITFAKPIPLYSGAAPGTKDWTHTEQAFFSTLFNTKVVTNVVRPLNEHGVVVFVARYRLVPGGDDVAAEMFAQGQDHRCATTWLT